MPGGETALGGKSGLAGRGGFVTGGRAVIVGGGEIGLSLEGETALFSVLGAEDGN